MTAETAGAALARVRAALTAAGVDSAALDARLLTASALNVPVETIVAHPERLLAADEEAKLTGLLRRRLASEPMAYILGRREFWSLDFEVTPDVLIPRPDTETVVDAVLAQTPDRRRPLRLLDLGVGSGCLLLALLHELPQARGVGVDVSARALDVARRNAGRLDLADRAEFVRSDWTQALRGQFDIVVSNPPYIRSADIAGLSAEVRREPVGALDGGPDGLDAYRALAPGALAYAAPGALIALEIGQGQGDAVARILAESGWQGAGRRADLAGIERAVLARKPS